MARKEVLIDDLDGTTEGATTFKFSLGEADYEIDLAGDSQAKVDKMFAQLVAKSREVTKTKAPGGNGNSAIIRVWALQHDVEVSPKGKIPSEVVEKYEAWKVEEQERREAPAGAAAPTPPAASPASTKVPEPARR